MLRGHVATQRQVTTGFATGLHDYHDSETPWIRLRLDLLDLLYSIVIFAGPGKKRCEK
jgi:hypothetical protein